MSLDLTEEQKQTIFDSTGGICHLCHKKVARKNYGAHGKRGAWEADHSVARANGGTDRINNLRPAHTSCNRQRQDLTARAYRARNGVVGLPPSREAIRAAAVATAVLVVSVAAGVVCLALWLYLRHKEQQKAAAALAFGRQPWDPPV